MCRRDRTVAESLNFFDQVGPRRIDLGQCLLKFCKALFEFLGWHGY
jgi:hypothetical protein